MQHPYTKLLTEIISDGILLFLFTILVVAINHFSPLENFETLSNYMTYGWIIYFIVLVEDMSKSFLDICRPKYTLFLF